MPNPPACILLHPVNAPSPIAVRVSSIVYARQTDEPNVRGSVLVLAGGPLPLTIRETPEEVVDIMNDTPRYQSDPLDDEPRHPAAVARPPGVTPAAGWGPHWLGPADIRRIIRTARDTVRFYDRHSQQPGEVLPEHVAFARDILCLAFTVDSLAELDE